jgi:hypothetical protein
MNLLPAGVAGLTLPVMDQMPSDEERRRFAAGTQDLPDFAKLTVEDIELMDEEHLGKPVNPGSAAEGMAAMQRRLKLLAQHKAKTLTTLESCPDQLRTALVQDLSKLNQAIATAEERLTFYQQQEKAKN